MTLRTKLISIIVAFVMVASLMMVSIFASPTITMQMGGNVSFNATDLQVTISDGVLANGTLEDSANKMKGVKIDAYDDGAEELATWQNLNLIFNESEQDMTITFTITNNSKTDNVKAAVSVNQGTATNATVSLTTPSTSPATIQANNGSQQFVITFHVVDRNSPASITGFQIDIDLEKESGSGSGSTDTESYTVTFNDIEDEDNTNTYYIKSDISDTIISQLHNYFIHRLVNEEDLRKIYRTVAFADKASNDMIPILPAGGCLVSGLSTNFPVLVQIDILPSVNRPKSENVDINKAWLEQAD